MDVDLFGSKLEFCQSIIEHLIAFVCVNLIQLDGYIARTWPTQKSALGSALDPLADKILISILYVSLTYAELIPGTRLQPPASCALVPVTTQEPIKHLQIFMRRVTTRVLITVLCFSSADGPCDLQGHWFDRCCFLGQVQDCSSTGEKNNHSKHCIWCWNCIKYLCQKWLDLYWW